MGIYTDRCVRDLRAGLDTSIVSSFDSAGYAREGAQEGVA